MSKTEVEKSLAEQQIREMQREISYDLRDFTIDYIVKEFAKDRFYIPEYQREFVWDIPTQVRFIESVLLGLPIPFMFFADTEEGFLEIVDGAQRVQTLESFYNNDLVLIGLTRLTALDGFSFNELPTAQQRKLENRALRVIVLEDKTTVAIRHEIFNRINTGGKKAKPSEVRKGAFSGPFMDFIKECSDNPLFKKLCPISKTLLERGEAQELIIRFFAYSESYLTFKHDVSTFLDDYVIKRRDEFDREELESRFLNMLSFVDQFFPYGFAKSATAKSTPRVRFEAISVGTALALQLNPDLRPGSMDWLETEEFKLTTTTHASNSAPRLRGRVEFVRDHLLGDAECKM